MRNDNASFATDTDTSMSFVNVPSNIDQQAPTLKVTTTPKHDIVGLASELKKIQACVNMKARELPDDDSHRSAVDIIVALDVSGSMNGFKLDLCKKTLLLLLRVLYPGDRFGLICYAENAKIEIPAQKMTDANKRKCAEKIQGLRTRGCTNMSAAVGLAREEMRQIDTPNEVQTVFLLTDGHANAGIQGNDLVAYTKNCFVNNLTLEGTEGPEDQPLGRGSWFRRRASQRNEDTKPTAKPSSVVAGAASSNPITLHCFGVGTDHDSDLLTSMSDVVPGGSYYFIENDADVGSAFGDALGGILSVVAQNVFVTISIPEEAKGKGVEIVEVHHENKVKRENGSWTIVVGDFYAEESRDLLFELGLANSSGGSEPFPHAQVSVSYTDTLLKAPEKANPTACMIARPLGTELSSANPHVEVQWARLMATQAMERANHLASTNDYEGATACLQSAQMRIRSTRRSAPAAYHGTLNFLDADMTELSAGMSSKSMYDSIGAHKAKSKFSSHSKQRASTVQASAYSNSKKCRMKAKFATSK